MARKRSGPYSYNPGACIGAQEKRDTKRRTAVGPPYLTISFNGCCEQNLDSLEHS